MLDIVVSCQLGRACHFLETSTCHQLEDGDGRMSGRQSGSFIVLMKLGNASGGTELHSNGLSEDTSTVLRNGGIDGNKIRKNSRNIGDNAEARVHISVSLDKCGNADAMP